MKSQKMEKSKLKKTLIRGMITLAPLGISLVIFVWIIRTLDGFFGPVIQKIIGDKYYFPGAGFISAIIIIFLLGLIINTWLIKRTYDVGEKIIGKIPFFNVVYSSLKKFFNYFEENNSFGTPVKVNFGEISFIGFVTRKDFENILIKKQKDQISVYLPLSYQIGGMMLIIDSSKVEDINLNVEETMRFVFLGGIIGKNNDD